MMYLSSFNYRPRLFRVVEIETGSILDINYSKLMEFVREHKIENLTLRDGKVAGNKVSLDQFPRISERSNKVYLVSKNVNNGVVVNYTLIYSNGKVGVLSFDDLYNTVNLLGCVNARTDRYKEEVYLTDGTYKTIPVGRKKVDFCLEDYQELYKKYKEAFGIGRMEVSIEFSNDEQFDGNAFNPAAVHSVPSEFNRFMKDHILLTNILSKCEVIGYSPVFKSFKIGNVEGITKLNVHDIVGYLLTYRHKSIGEHHVLIHKEDRKLLNFITFESARKKIFETLKEMITYSAEEKIDSGLTTGNSLLDYEKIKDQRISSEIEYSLKNGIYRQVETVENGENGKTGRENGDESRENGKTGRENGNESMELKIKDTINICNSQIVLMYNLLNK